MAQTEPDTEPKPDICRGTPESAAYFVRMLEEIGETKTSLARFMKRKGDDRPTENIVRSLQKIARRESRLSGEMRVLLTLLRTGKRNAMRRDAALAAAAQPSVH